MTAPSAAPPRFAERRALLVLLGVAVLARLLTAGNPIVHVDEQFYYATGQALWGGTLPFVDIWDRKPVGLFLVYAVPGRLGLPAGIWAYQLLALLALVATARLVVAMARRAGWRQGAIWAGVAYCLWPNLIEGQGGQSPIFYNLPVALAAALLMTDAAPSFRRGAFAMALLGVALQIKYSVVFEGVFFGLWCMVRDWQARRSIAGTAVRGAALAMVALVPTLLVALYYGQHGAFPAWWFANVTAITLRRANPLINQYGDLLSMLAIVSPLLAADWLVWRRCRAAGLTRTQLFAFGWLLAAAFGVAVFGTWFLHYALPVLVPACLCAAGIGGAPAGQRRFAAVALAAAAIGGQAVIVAKLIGRGGAAQFYALARRVDDGRGCLFVYSGPPMLYAASSRCRATRYTFPTQLSRDRENGAIGTDQATEIRRIMATAPATVVMRRPYLGERPDIHALELRYLRNGYRLEATMPLGSDQVAIFRRR